MSEATNTLEQATRIAMEMSMRDDGASPSEPMAAARGDVSDKAEELERLSAELDELTRAYMESLETGDPAITENLFAKMQIIQSKISELE